MQLRICQTHDLNASRTRLISMCGIMGFLEAKQREMEKNLRESFHPSHLINIIRLFRGSLLILALNTSKSTWSLIFDYFNGILI